MPGAFFDEIDDVGRANLRKRGLKAAIHLPVAQIFVRSQQIGSIPGQIFKSKRGPRPAFELVLQNRPVQLLVADKPNVPDENTFPPSRIFVGQHQGCCRVDSLPPVRS